MNKYYMIPLDSISAKINDNSLAVLLKHNYPTVYDAILDNNVYNDYLNDDCTDEEDRQNKKYIEDEVIDSLEKFNLPYYILAKKDDDGIEEYETKSEIKIDGISEDVYQCSKTRFITYYNQGYVDKIMNLLTLTEEMTNTKKGR